MNKANSRGNLHSYTMPAKTFMNIFFAVFPNLRIDGNVNE